MLVVDDIYRIGFTMERAKLELTKSKPRTLKSAVLSYSGYGRGPDFYHHTYWKDVKQFDHYPWEEKLSPFYGDYQNYLRDLKFRDELRPIIDHGLQIN